VVTRTNYPGHLYFGDQSNAGNVTVRQATTIVNEFAEIPAGKGQTQVLQFTIPKGKSGLLKRVRYNITRANGSLGSATIELSTRELGGGWQVKRSFEIQTGSPVEFTQWGADFIHEQTDIRSRVVFVSDNNTIVDGAYEILLEDND